jgi:Zn-dependent protease
MLLQPLVQGDFAGFLVVTIVLLTAISLHEFGHAVAATAQGDPGPKLAGRLTLNPLKHLDPVGTFMLFLASFGWGKPVEFSPRNLRSKRAGVAIVALAGPAVNVLLAILGAWALANLNLGPFLQRLASAMIQLNVMLAVFNLIPIPPLDGSRILTLLLPPSRQGIIFFLDKWGILLLLALVFLFGGILLTPLIEAATKLIVHPFGLDYVVGPGRA